MVWKEIGETVNHFRQTSLQLEPMELMLAPGLFHRLQIPVVYFRYEVKVLLWLDMTLTQVQHSHDFTAAAGLG